MSVSGSLWVLSCRFKVLTFLKNDIKTSNVRELTISFSGVPNSATGHVKGKQTGFLRMRIIFFQNQEKDMFIEPFWNSKESQISEASLFKI